MPLPNLNKRCVVTARSTGERCKNPAAFGCRSCKFHGARRKTTIRSGKDHPQYIHGKRSLEGQKEYRKVCAELRAIEDLAYAYNIMEGPRTRGPKPNSS